MSDSNSDSSFFSSLNSSEFSVEMKLYDSLHLREFIRFLDRYQNPFSTVNLNLVWSSVEVDAPRIRFTLNKQDASVQNKICVSNLIPNIDFDQILGYQRHLCKQEWISKVRTNGSLSLGQIRENISLSEPIIRDAMKVSFYSDAIRASDIAYQGNSIVSGLFAEEACQLMKYIGGANFLEHLDLYLPNDIEENKNWYSLYAELIWYFIEGVHTSVTDHPTLKEFQTYFIALENQEFEFAQSKISGRWWIAHKNEYISCSHQEYVSITKGEIPERLTLLV